MLIVTRVSGLPRGSATGFFGFHIHRGQNCSGPDLSGTGSHYNPVERVHPKHAGDLPPLLECQGNAYLSIRTDRFSVSDSHGKEKLFTKWGYTADDTQKTA